tara:strand:+ start:436 stop:570 length:135 start_codon:yes stop_codon:yes gene_type:complete
MNICKFKELVNQISKTTESIWIEIGELIFNEATKALDNTIPNYE